MKLIVFSDDIPRKHEAEMIKDIIALTKNDFHLYKPLASEGDVASLLNTLDDESLARIVLHHQKHLASDFPVKGVHKSRNEPPNPQAVSLSALELQEPEGISQADYAFFSPVFSSFSKKNLNPKYSVHMINAWVSASPYDYYALGGVDLDRIKALSGFTGVAVKGAAWENENPVRYIESMLRHLDQCQC